MVLLLKFSIPLENCQLIAVGAICAQQAVLDYMHLPKTKLTVTYDHLILRIFLHPALFSRSRGEHLIAVRSLGSFSVSYIYYLHEKYFIYLDSVLYWILVPYRVFSSLQYHLRLQGELVSS